jgi:mono/diheme cytochrome c family protein
MKLKPYLLPTAAALALLVPTALPAGPPQTGAKSPAKLSAEAQAKAKTLYMRDCALCHGDHGDGKTDLAKDMQLTMIDWTAPEALAHHPDQELFDIIRKGKDKMPPEEPARAKDEEVWILVTYIRGLARPGGGPGQPAAPPTTGTTPPASTSPSAPQQAAPAGPASAAGSAPSN